MWFYSFPIQSMTKKPDKLSWYTFLHMQQLILPSQLAPRTWIISRSLLPMLLSSEEYDVFLDIKKASLPLPFCFSRCVCAARCFETVVGRISDQRGSGRWQLFWCALRPQIWKTLSALFSSAHNICLTHTHTHTHTRTLRWQTHTCTPVRESSWYRAITVSLIQTPSPRQTSQ